MDPTHEVRMFNRLFSDSEFRQWLELEERKEVGGLIEQVDPVRIYQSQARVKYIQSLLKRMQLGHEKLKG